MALWPLTAPEPSDSAASSGMWGWGAPTCQPASHPPVQIRLTPDAPLTAAAERPAKQSLEPFRDQSSAGPSWHRAPVRAPSEAPLQVSPSEKGPLGIPLLHPRVPPASAAHPSPNTLSMPGGPGLSPQAGCHLSRMQWPCHAPGPVREGPCQPAKPSQPPGTAWGHFRSTGEETEAQRD